MFAIIKGLKGERVNIITSSSVLAIRDSKSNKEIFEMFGLTVSNNCDDEC